MKTLGLNISGYISSAALAEDGRIVAAACEERFSRIKRDRAFPYKASEYVLQQGGIALRDVDAVAVAWNPGHHLSRNLNLHAEANSVRAKHLTYVPNCLAAHFGTAETPQLVQEVLGNRIVYLDHHLAHAASCCFTSPWKSGAVVTVDAFGESDSITIGTFADNRIELRERTVFPHSPGSFYSYFTEFLGYRSDADEYKVMALGAYADVERGKRLARKVDRTFSVEVPGDRLRFELDLARFDHYLFHRARGFAPLAELLGMQPRRPGQPLEASHFALAWAVQRAFERIVGTILIHARRLTGETRVALAGGCFMNSVANGKLEGAEGGFEAVHIPPYPDDSGTAIGAALYVNLEGTDRPSQHYRHNFFGPQVKAEEAVRALTRRKIGFSRVDDVAGAVARAVADGEIVAYATGGMEFGQRALGHRSIFADPRDPRIRDKVNENIKNRELFRPYAASVLEEKVAAVFDVPRDFRAYFMEKVRGVRPEWADRIRGILHADNSVRLQTVDRETNPRLFEILSAFDALTGVPLMLNTSFNVSGMPIACDVDDAIGCFFASGIDSLFIDDVRISKSALSLSRP